MKKVIDIYLYLRKILCLLIHNIIVEKKLNINNYNKKDELHLNYYI